VSHWIRVHFLVIGCVSDHAVFRADWAHDAHINEFDAERADQKTVADWDNLDIAQFVFI
jgi:hypothetical protein